MDWVEGKYAVRSVRRNFRRTLLSVLGIGIGCGLALFVDSINRGKDELYVRTAAESGSGHLRVAPAGWRLKRDPELRLADGARDLAIACATPGVKVAVPRSRAQVLLAMGAHVVPIEMVGVDPKIEPLAYRFVRRMAEGRYLAPGERDAMVIGRAVADRLDVGLGDEVFASAVDPKGDIQSALFQVVGIVATGSEEVDAGICQVGLPDLERLTGRSGIGEITLLIDDWRATPTLRDDLARRVAAGDEVLTWRELSPEFEGHLRQDTASSQLVTGIIIVIVLLGVTSAQLAAVLERRREFAVLSALGMSAWRLVRLILQEAVVLGLAGALTGLAIAAPLVWQCARAGIDFRRWMGGSYSFQGIIIEPILYSDFGAWMLLEALIIGLGATLIASLYPARFAARTDPAAALRSVP